MKYTIIIVTFFANLSCMDIAYEQMHGKLGCIKEKYIPYIKTLSDLSKDMNLNFTQLIATLRSSQDGKWQKYIDSNEFVLVIGLLERVLQVEGSDLKKEKNIKSYIKEQSYSIEQLVFMIEIADFFNISYLLIPLLDNALDALVNLYKKKQVDIADNFVRTLISHQIIIKERLMKFYFPDILEKLIKHAVLKKYSDYASSLDKVDYIVIESECVVVISADIYEVFTIDGESLYQSRLSHGGNNQYNRFHNGYCITIVDEECSQVTIRHFSTGDLVCSFKASDFQSKKFERIDVYSDMLVLITDNKIIIINETDFSTTCFDLANKIFRIFITQDKSMAAIVYMDHIDWYDLHSQTHILRSNKKIAHIFFDDENDEIVVMHNTSTISRYDYNLKLIGETNYLGMWRLWINVNDFCYVNSTKEIIFDCANHSSQLHSHSFDTKNGTFIEDVKHPSLAMSRALSSSLRMFTDDCSYWGSSVMAIYDYAAGEVIKAIAMPSEFKLVTKDRRYIRCKDGILDLHNVLERFTVQELLTSAFSPTDNLLSNCVIL